MSGLIYKNFRINRGSFLFSLITAFVCCLTGVLMGIFMGGAESINDGSDVAFIYVLLYYLAFMLPSMATSMLFEADESKVCCAFAMSCPQGGKGHIEAKYWYLLIMNLSLLFMCFISDTVTFGIFGGKVSVTTALLLIFCWRILLSAIQVPFIIRFGSQRGVAIKGVVIGVIFFLFMVYIMFGDITWLLESDDPIDSLIAWLQGGDAVFWLGLFPYLSIAAYWISCKISVKLFRKGAESYEQ